MVNVTINMSMEDFETLKNALLEAEQNTYVSDREGAEADKEKVKQANARINRVLNLLGCQ